MSLLFSSKLINTKGNISKSTTKIIFYLVFLLNSDLISSSTENIDLRSRDDGSVAFKVTSQFSFVWKNVRKK